MHRLACGRGFGELLATKVHHNGRGDSDTPPPPRRISVQGKHKKSPMSEMKDLKRRREGDDAENSTMQLALPNSCGRTRQELGKALGEGGQQKDEVRAFLL